MRNDIVVPVPVPRPAKPIMSLFLLLSSLAIATSGQQVEDENGLRPGDLDRSFVTGSGADRTVLSVVNQPDGRILIGGAFTNFNGVPRRGVARLNSDGSLDPFDARIWGQNAQVSCVAVDTAGRVVVGGQNMYVWEDRFERVYAYKSLVRFSSRSEALLAHGMVRTIVAHPDGWLLVGGSDVGNWRVPSNSWIGAIALQADGKTLLGGSFTSGSSLVRVNENGSLDETFSANVSASVSAMVVQPDQRIIIAGNFAIGESSNMRVARLQPDGTLDSSFQARLPNGWLSAPCLALQRDGKVLVGGNVWRGMKVKMLLRLNIDGSEDLTFRSPLSSGQTDEGILSLGVQPDGRIVIGGHFTHINGVPAANIARLWGDDLPPAITAVARAGAALTLTWRAQPNRAYRVQYCEDLSANVWINLAGDVTADNVMASKTDTSLVEAAQRFYRVVLLPEVPSTEP